MRKYIIIWLVTGLLSIGIYAQAQNADGMSPLPEKTVFLNSYPNPFNATTTIEYTLAESGPVDLRIFDIAGRIVATIAGGIYPAGYYRETWNAGDRASGLYFVRLQAGQYKETKKIVLLK